MDNTLVFGWRTAVLAVAFSQLLLLATALACQSRNRPANRTLAALLITLAGMITPWMIGFAGFYDRWQWLSFAPFAVSLAIGPLAYLYLYALIYSRWPVAGWRHLIPAGIQFAYLGGAFVSLRQPFKNEWLVRSAVTYDVIIGLGVVAGLVAYSMAGRSLIRRYATWLSHQRSDDHRFALSWVGRAVAALFVLLAVWTAYGVTDLIRPLGYTGLMGLYVGIAAIALFIGIEGWRHAALPFPAMVDAEPSLLPSSDWKRRADDWAERIRRDRLYADPELSVASLARTLGTNSAYVSRALNDGLGQNFSAFINRLRSEDVAARLRGGANDDLLDLALVCGFSSKASFNRAFRIAFDCSPSAYRHAHGSNAKKFIG
jgi:AraC-like DNA-binding protein